MLALVGMSLVWFKNCSLLFKYEHLMFLLKRFTFSLCVCVSVCLRITAMYISPMTLFLLFTTQCNRCTEFASTPVGALSVERHNRGLLGVGTATNLYLEYKRIHMMLEEMHRPTVFVFHKYYIVPITNIASTCEFT